MLTHHLKLSIRNLQKNKLFSILNIGGFAVGFAVCMILALFAYKEKTVDTGYKNHRDIYRLVDANHNSTRIDYDLTRKLAEKYPEIEMAILLNYTTFDICQNRIKEIGIREVNGAKISEIVMMLNQDFVKWA
jgi:putative ABC transport system permease protein